MDKYAMYLRKSRADIELESMGHEETLARHKARLFELAARMEVLPEQIVIYHEIVSGESIQDRPEMQKLLNDVYLQKYKGVFVIEVERLARGNTKDQGEVADAFQYSHTQIITEKKIYDPTKESDMEYFEFGLFMSRREYKTITRRMSAGKLQSVKEGNYIGSAKIYGYDPVRTSKKDRILKINPEEAPVVQMIYNWYTEDRQSPRWIARQLTTLGIPTQTNKSEWNRRTIINILQNEHYIGLIKWNQRKTVRVYNADTGKTQKIRVPAEKELYPGKHEAIISKEQFEKAQSIFDQFVPIKSEAKHVNPFAGIARCAKCGKTLVAQEYSEKNNRSLRLSHQKGTVCKMKSIKMFDFSAAVVDALKNSIADYEVELKKGSEQKQILEHEAIIAALEKELEKQQRKRTRLFDAFEDDLYSKEEFIERKQALHAKISEISDKLKEEKKNAPKPINYEQQITTIHNLIECINDDSISAQLKNTFLKSFIEKIDVEVLDCGRNNSEVIVDIQLK